MGHGDFSRQWGRHGEERWGQHRGGWAGQWSGGPWGGWGGPFDGRRNRPGPPPWVAELFGLAQGQQQRGPKVRRPRSSSASTRPSSSSCWIVG